MSKFQYLIFIGVVCAAVFSVDANARVDGVGEEATSWCERDCSNEYHFFKRFAGQGSSIANLSLAIMNYRGHGREIDIEAGNRFLFKAAKANEPLAMYQFGYFLLYGLYVEQDIERSLGWFKKASQHNILNAKQMASLVERYLAGEQSAQFEQVKAILIQKAQPSALMTGYQENQNGDIERISVIHGFTWEQALIIAKQQTCKINCDVQWSFMLYPRVRAVNEQQLFDLMASLN